jgi:hypothetical protein
MTTMPYYEPKEASDLRTYKRGSFFCRLLECKNVLEVPPAHVRKMERRCRESCTLAGKNDLIYTY